MSTMTRSGGSTLSVVTSLCRFPSRASSLPRKKTSTPATRIVAIARSVASGRPPTGALLAFGAVSVSEVVTVARAEEVPPGTARIVQAGERDLAIVHVAVAWYHAAVTGRPVACERQLDKAARRLEPYAPVHRRLDVAALLGSIAAARGRFPDLPRPRLRRTRASD